MRRTLTTAALALPMLAAAQWGGSIVAASEDRARGLATTSEEPSLRATLGWDGAGGAFAGASALRYRFNNGTPALGLQAYAGFTRLLAAGMRWEAGIDLQRVDGNPRGGYDELFTGVADAGGDWSLRLHASPDYFATGIATVYADLALRRDLADGWRAVLHAGALRRGDGRQGLRWDLRAGIARTAWDIDWQLAWHAVRRGGPFAPPASQHAQRLVVSAAWVF